MRPPGNAAGLPVVVLIEAANPSIVLTGTSRWTLWQEEQNSAVCSFMKGLRNVRDAAQD